jgi:hypothetical protein
MRRLAVLLTLGLLVVAAEPAGATDVETTGTRYLRACSRQYEGPWDLEPHDVGETFTMTDLCVQGMEVAIAGAPIGVGTETYQRAEWDLRTCTWLSPSSKSCRNVEHETANALPGTVRYAAGVITVVGHDIVAGCDASFVVTSDTDFDGSTASGSACGRDVEWGWGSSATYYNVEHIDLP